MDFEKKMHDLEDIVKSLEDGNLSLNEMISLYEQGMKLSADCGKLLDEAEIKINILSKTEKGLEKVVFSEENL